MERVRVWPFQGAERDIEVVNWFCDKRQYDFRYCIEKENAMSWYLAVLKKYAVFSGRARRKEYWMFVLFNFIITACLCFVLGFISAMLNTPGLVVLAQLYYLAVFLPGLGVSVRRLHDTGKSGWMLLLGLIPVIGGIILLVFMVLDSQPGSNQYGENPKGM